MSYNVLCDTYADSFAYLYTACAPESLDWQARFLPGFSPASPCRDRDLPFNHPPIPWRRCFFFQARLPRLLAQISARRPDIVCLQEVSRLAYTRDFAPTMAALGFAGAYAQRENRVDGSAVFFKVRGGVAGLAC